MPQKHKNKFRPGKKSVIAATAGFAALAVWYFAHLPAAVYWRGKLQASRHKIGKVEGLSLYRIPADYHRQEHSLSCEIAALQMALSAQGAAVPESELLSKLAFDPTPRANGVWGDPDKGFVGNIDGKMGKDGYGVYADPIVQVALHYRYAEVMRQPSEAQLIENIKAYRPVVVWGYAGGGKKISWQTPDGKTVNGINGEHARVVVGMVGSSALPDGYILLDPIYGELYWTRDQFLENWDALNDMAVVVYPESVQAMFSGADAEAGQPPFAQ